MILVKKNDWLYDFWVCLGGGRDPLNGQNREIGGFSSCLFILFEFVSELVFVIVFVFE